MCGAWMPRAKTTFARTPGHGGDCMSATNMVNSRKYNRLHGHRESPESRRKSNRKYRICSYGLTQEQFDRFAFVAANISFEPVDDSSARVTLTDHGRTATATMFFDTQGRLTAFVAKRYRAPGASDPETWSTPITGYGQFEGLRLPAGGPAVWKLPGGDFAYIEVAVTELRYDTAPEPEQVAR